MSEKNEIVGTRESIWTKRIKEIQSINQPVEMLFLGDSTIRVAIDDALIKQVSGIKSMNLGLTGNFVSYGDYAILKRYLKLHKPPKAIVVWHTINVWNRNLDLQLLAFTKPGLADTWLALKNVLRNLDQPVEYFQWPIEYSAQLLRMCASE